MRAVRPVLLSVLVLGAVVPLAQAQSVSVSATITGEVVPGVYGQVVLGNRPPPPLVYAQPVIVVAQPVVIEPIYLYVPPDHAKHWSKHCHEYNACNRPVYFVRSPEYEPGYRPERRHDEEHEHAHHGEHGDRHDDRDRGDHDHGHHDD